MASRISRSQLIGMIARLRGELYSYIYLMEDTGRPEEEINELYKLANDTGNLQTEPGDLVKDETGYDVFDTTWISKE